MKKYLCLVVIILVLPFILKVEAKENIIKTTFFETPEKLSLPKSSLSYWFRIPSNTSSIKESELNIHLAYSKTLIPHLSSIGVSINDIPLETKWIYDITTAEGGWWKIKVPLNNLKIGETNHIKIESNHRSREGDCADIDNPDNWVLLYEDSYLKLIENEEEQLDLNQFYPVYYEKVSHKNTLKTEFVLPSFKQVQPIENMMKLACAVGVNYPGARFMNYQVTTQDKLGSLMNKIFIGEYENWNQAYFKQLIVPIKLEEGFISIQGPTKETPYYKTLVTGNDIKGQEKSIEFICKPMLVRQIMKPFLHINSQLSKVQNPVTYHDDGLYTLKEFGYDTLRLTGAFHQKAGITLVQPKGLQGQKDAYIDIKFKHSDLLVPERSVLSACINGIQVASTKLTHGNAQEGTLKIPIPQEALLKPTIKVDFEVYHYIGKVDCSKDYDDSAWTVIENSSSVYLKSSRLMLPLSLQDFPYIMPGEKGEEAKLTCQIEPRENQEVLKTATLIASRLGQNTRQIIDFKCNADLKDNLLFIGKFNTLIVPKEIKELLPVVQEENGNFKIQEGLAILPETLTNKVLIQVIPSPFVYDKRIYVVMYDTKESLKVFNECLQDTQFMWKLKGQVACTGKNKAIETFVLEQKQVTTPLTPEEIAKQIQDNRKMPWWIFGSGIIVLIVLITVIIKISKKNKRKKYRL